jgi:hypothetical protein
MKLNIINYSKKIFVTLVASSLLLLSDCGEQLIKPENKKIQAMLEVDIPDYENTTINIAKKIEIWMKDEGNYQDDKVVFISSNVNYLKANGVVSFEISDEILRVSYQIKAEVINTKLVKLTMTKFKDLSSTSSKYSDIAYIFYHKVKKPVLDMTDRLEEYLNKNTKNI